MDFSRVYRLALAASLAALCSACGSDYEQGQLVLANYGQRAYAYPATITAVGDEEVTVQYLDDSSTESLPLALVREFDWEEGSEIECSRGGGNYLSGEIDDLDDPQLTFEFENGEEADLQIGNCRELTGNAEPAAQTASSNQGGDGDAPCPGPGLTRRCNGVCVNIQEDDNNCGGCGVVCPSGKSCDGHMSCRDAEGNL